MFEEAPGQTKVITWEEVVKGIHRASMCITSRMSVQKEVDAPVVAILASLGVCNFVAENSVP